MSEMPRNASELTPDLVQALRMIRSKSMAQAALRLLHLRGAAGATLREITIFARQRGYSWGNRPPGRDAHGYIFDLARHDLVTKTPVSVRVRGCQKWKADAQQNVRVYQYKITGRGRQALQLYDTVDMSTI